MSEKSKWTYIFSDTLNMKVAYNSETKIVTTEDKVEYTPDEIDALKDGVITLQLHRLKKIFNGKVLKSEN